MKKLICFFTLSIIFISCESTKSDLDQATNTDEWTVSEQFIGKGTPFELMNVPGFKSVHEINSLSDDSKVALVSFKNEVRVYPYFYTNTYEVVNDVFDSNFIAVSFCPLTESAICFNRKINTKVYNFIASGYLYKNNMVPSDETQNLFWSQMLMKGIKGEFANQSLNSFNLIETNWKTVKTFFPNAHVFFHSNAKNFKQKKSVKDLDFAFGIFNTNGKESVELFFYDDFYPKITAVIKTINQRETFIVGSKEKRLLTAYYTPTDTTLSLLDETNFPNIIADTKGNIYTIFGYAISGPNIGTQLESPKSYVAQYLAWKDFYSDLNSNN